MKKWVCRLAEKVLCYAIRSLCVSITAHEIGRKMLKLLVAKRISKECRELGQVKDFVS